MNNHTDQDAREAREWAEYITSVRDLHGDHAPQARAAARFILDNTTPALPDPLFLAKATHPEQGEGVVTSHFPVVDGTVRFMFPDEASNDGTAFQWVEPSTLTFHTPDMSKNGAEIDTSTEHVDPIDTTPDHPAFLATEEDYSNAPEGTIVAYNENKPLVLIDELWRHIGLVGGSDHYAMAGTRRRPLLDAALTGCDAHIAGRPHIINDLKERWEA